jgi:CheY-like chemotaxis protein
MKKILLVYSLIVFCEKNRDLLNRSDFRIYTAISGKEALRIHRARRVDLIIADLDMPDMGGDELCSIIRSEEELRNVSVLLACRDTPEELERIAQCGANAWVTKPLQVGSFLERVARLLEISLRKDYRVLLKAAVQGEKEDRSFFCTSYNISASGILIETGEILEQGARITITFFLPGARQIVAEGEAIRSVMLTEGCYHYGIRFVDLAAGFRQEIEQFVASLTGSSG